MKYTNSQYGKFFYFNNCEIGKAIEKGQFWEDFYKPWFDKLGPGDSFVDVGANIGFFTIYAAKRGAWAWAFEASPEVFALLKQNVEGNGVGDLVRCDQVALYDQERELILNPEWVESMHGQTVDYESMWNSGGMSLVAGSGPGSYHARFIDSYWMSPTLLKVDVQGADIRVLRGALGTIKRCRPTILFEVEPIPARLHGDSVNGVLDLMDTLGYDVQCVREGGYGVQDFVAVPRG